MQPWMITTQIMGALPLAIYPLVLFGAVKSLIGYKEPKEYHPLGRLFLWSNLLYPVVFVVCFTLAREARDERLALIFSVAPLVYLVLVAVCLFIWLKNIFR